MIDNNIYMSKQHSNLFIAILHLKEAAILLTDSNLNLSTTLLQIVKVLIEQSTLSEIDLTEINNIAKNTKNEEQV